MPDSTEDFMQKQADRLEAFKAESAGNTLSEATKPTEKLSIQEPVKKEEALAEPPKETVKAEGKIINLDPNKKPEPPKELDEDTKNHLDWLNKDEDAPVIIENPNEKLQEELNKYKSRAAEYDELTKDDLNKAFLDWRKSGGSDIEDFKNKIGIVDVNKITIEDIYKQKAIDAGLKGEEADQAIEEAVEKFKSMPKLDQSEVLNKFRGELKVKTETNVKKFIAGNEAYEKHKEQVGQVAFTEIESGSKELVGKKFRGLLIDEKMSKEIAKMAPKYSIEIFDEQGKLIGYNAKKGLELAIYDKYGKQLLKAQYDLAELSAYDKAIKERNRPSENNSANQIVVTAPNNIEEAMKGWREEWRTKNISIGK